MQRKALGRGLDALIAGTGGGAPAAVEAPQGALEIPIQEVSPNPHQPRSRFDGEAIEELAASIRATGVLQPIIVRRAPGGGFQLVAGERRLRAAGSAGLNRIPAVVREVDDAQMLELALVENVQREDLGPIEEAQAYRNLAERLRLTHDEISERVGKQRVSITNALRLLSLPPEVQEMVSRGTLSAGQARALLSLATPGEVLIAARYVAAKGFSVRRTEAFVRRRLRRKHAKARRSAPAGMSEWEEKLQRRFATRVMIAAKPKGGVVQFEFYGQGDLERLLEAWGVM